MIISIDDSPRKGKRFRVIWQYEHGGTKAFDFGQSPRGNTYIDGATDETRMNYWRRHMANEKERFNIENLIPSPSLFSAYLLWGNSRNIHENIKELNKIMR
jgi:hypothetical protein